MSYKDNILQSNDVYIAQTACEYREMRKLMQIDVFRKNREVISWKVRFFTVTEGYRRLVFTVTEGWFFTGTVTEG